MHRHGFFHRFFAGCHKRKDAWLTKRVIKKLTLDAKQVEKLSVFTQQIQFCQDDNQAARKDSRRQLQELLLAPQPDREQAKTVLRKKLAAFVEQGNSMVDAFGDFVDSLNPQQRQQLHAYINKHEARRGCCH